MSALAVASRPSWYVWALRRVPVVVQADTLDEALDVYCRDRGYNRGRKQYVEEHGADDLQAVVDRRTLGGGK